MTDSVSGWGETRGYLPDPGQAPSDKTCQTQRCQDPGWAQHAVWQVWPHSLSFCFLWKSQNMWTIGTRYEPYVRMLTKYKESHTVFSPGTTAAMNIFSTETPEVWQQL